MPPGHLSIEPMSDVFKQLSDASRLAVLHALWNGRLSVGEIATRTGLSQPNASHHLSQLKSMGLVKVEKEGQRSYYSIADKHVFTILKECNEHVRQPIA